MGIEHVYDSRSVEFAEQIRRDTAGYGVDIVLNSVTGAAQLAGLKLLALGAASSKSANATSTPIPDWNSCHSGAIWRSTV